MYSVNNSALSFPNFQPVPLGCIEARHPSLTIARSTEICRRFPDSQANL
jgi:hypothetical protein